MRFGRRRALADIEFEYTCWTPVWSPERLTEITPPDTDTVALHATLVELHHLGAGILSVGQVFREGGALPRTWWATVGVPMPPGGSGTITDDMYPGTAERMVGARPVPSARLPIGVGNRGSLAEAAADLLPLIERVTKPRTT